MLTYGHFHIVNLVRPRFNILLGALPLGFSMGIPSSSPQILLNLGHQFAPTLRVLCFPYIDQKLPLTHVSQWSWWLHDGEWKLFPPSTSRWRLHAFTEIWKPQALVASLLLERRLCFKAPEGSSDLRVVTRTAPSAACLKRRTSYTTYKEHEGPSTPATWRLNTALKEWDWCAIGGAVR